MSGNKITIKEIIPQMIKYINASNLTYKEWLKERKKGIGGSDAAAIAGLNPWRSALSVYLDKTTDQINTIDSERMRIGRDLEDYVAKRFEEATGKKVRRNNFILTKKDYPFIMANVDREVVGEKALLECKTTNSYALKDWEDGKIPIFYEIQCLHYLLVTGYERCYIAVLIGNEKFIWHTIERDEETLENLLEIEVDFWNNNVLANNPPPPDGSNEYTKILNDKYNKPKEDEIELVDSEKYLDRYFTLKEMIDEMDKEKKTIEQHIKSEMGDFTKARTDIANVTWSRFETNRLDGKRLKEELPEIWEQYINTSNSSRFTIKRI